MIRAKVLGRKYSTYNLDLRKFAPLVSAHRYCPSLLRQIRCLPHRPGSCWSAPRIATLGRNVFYCRLLLGVTAPSPSEKSLSVLTIKKASPRKESFILSTRMHTVFLQSFSGLTYRDLHRICMHCHKAVKAPLTGLQSSKRTESGSYVTLTKVCSFHKWDSFLRHDLEKVPQPLVRQSPDDSYGIAMTFFKFH